MTHIIKMANIREYRYVICVGITFILLALMLVNQYYLSFGHYTETNRRRSWEYAQFAMLLILAGTIAFCLTPEAYFELKCQRGKK